MNQANLNEMTLVQIAKLVNIPSIIKMSKEKAIARAQAELSKTPIRNTDTPRFDNRTIEVADVVVKSAKATLKAGKKILAKAVKEAKAPRGHSKHGLLLAALGEPLQTRDDLMKASGFDDKNLSVALCNLKNAGHVIKVELVEAEGGGECRVYSVVVPTHKAGKAKH